MISRICGVVLRRLYLYKRSLNRWMEIFYWPLLDLLVWGFLSVFFQKKGIATFNVITVILSAMILWDVLYRASQGVSFTFIEELWSRNLPNIFVSPLKHFEFLLGAIILSIIKLLLSMSIVLLFAYIFFSYNIATLSFYLFLFLTNLIILGWSIGVVNIGIILRFGEKAEVWIWGLPFLLQPFSCVFYPQNILPDWMRFVSSFLPSTYVFEGMRMVLNSGFVEWRLYVISLFLSLLYLVISFYFYLKMFNFAREEGRLYKVGE